MPVAPVIDWFATSSSLALVFICWHTFNYDRWRCFVFKRDDWFRTLMIWIHLLGAMCMVAGSWMLVYVVYQNPFITVGQEVRVTPWQLYTPEQKRLITGNAYLLAAMFWTLHICHAEEMIFWGYLIRAIRNPNNAGAASPQVWLKAPGFKVWAAITLFSGLILFGAASIEITDLEHQRSYLYIVTSGVSMLLSFGSFGLIAYLPGFIARMKDFGAGFEMQERLAVFQEVNFMRTFARMVSSICFMMIGADHISRADRIKNNGFADTFLPILAQAGLIVVYCLSVLILLPRNMSLESSIPKQETKFHPMMTAYKRPTPDRLANHHFWEMGQRLNLEQDALQAILTDRHATGGVAGHAYELSYSTSNHLHAQAANAAQQRMEATVEPQSTPIEGKRASVKNLQEMMGRLRSLDGQRADGPAMPTKIVVTTHEDQRID